MYYCSMHEPLGRISFVASLGSTSYIPHVTTTVGIFPSQICTKHISLFIYTNGTLYVSCLIANNDSV